MSIKQIMVASTLLAFHQVDSSLYLQTIVAQCIYYILLDVRESGRFRPDFERKELKGVE